jgi:ketosteroid isomerase-like protein
MAGGAYMIGWTGDVTIYEEGQALPGLPMKSFILSDLIARVYCDVVVVTGLAEAEGETPDKKPFSYKSRYLNVWKRLPHGWRIVVTENTVVKPPPPK